MNRKLIIQRIIPVFLIIWALINITHHYINNNPQGILWFCNTVIFVMAIGFWFKSKPLLISAAISYILFGILWTIDVIVFFATGKFILNVAVYLASSTPLAQLITFYHVVLLGLSLALLIHKRINYKHAWLISSAHLLIVLILSLFTKTNVNCVQEICEIGKLNFIYNLKPEFLPLFIFNWLVFTIIGFLPIQLILNRIKKTQA